MLARVARGWPLPVWVYPGVAALMAVMTAAVNVGLLRAEYSTWSQVSTAWHEGLWIPGVLLATVAAFIGSVLGQPGSPVNPGFRPREGAGVLLAHALALGGWAAAGHALAGVSGLARW